MAANISAARLMLRGFSLAMYSRNCSSVSVPVFCLSICPNSCRSLLVLCRLQARTALPGLVLVQVRCPDSACRCHRDCLVLCSGSCSNPYKCPFRGRPVSFLAMGAAYTKASHLPLSSASCTVLETTSFFPSSRNAWGTTAVRGDLCMECCA
jgi:hypothetical protein